jgi:exodeoxyribonuclease-3
MEKTLPLTIATWNVNSVKARLGHLTHWLARERPDIVLLQEIKCTDDSFPALEIEPLGYNIATHGQKTYNGVAILSKFPLDDVVRGLPGNEDDPQARYIEAVASLPGKAVRVASVYVPNGQDATSEKFPYKLAFLDRLHAHAHTLLGYDEPVVIGGDYNIAPTDLDVHAPKRWQGSVLTHDEVRKRLRRICNMGFADAFAAVNPGVQAFSWWDYRGGAFEGDEGLRIDHLLLSPQASDRLRRCRVDKGMRALEKASDHAPVVGEFAL